jgi:hypothetical protein
MQSNEKNDHSFVRNISYDSASATMPIYAIESLDVHYPSMNDKRPIVCLYLYNLAILVVVLKKHFGDEYFLPLISFLWRKTYVVNHC